MTKLLKSHRETLTKRLLDATFRERELRLKQQEHALGLALLRHMYSHEDLMRMAQLPDGWLPLYSQIHFKQEQTAYIDVVTLSDPVRLPAQHEHRPVAPPKWIEKWVEFRDARAALKVERNQLSSEILGTLAAFNTIEKLAEGWPEGYAHFPHPQLKGVGLPALRIEDLNARLTAAREAA